MTLTDKEKLEAIQQILDEISSKQRNYLDDTSLLDYFERQIKKILEYEFDLTVLGSYFSTNVLIVI